MQLQCDRMMCLQHRHAASPHTSARSHVIPIGRPPPLLHEPLPRRWRARRARTDRDVWWLVWFVDWVVHVGVLAGQLARRTTGGCAPSRARPVESLSWCVEGHTGRPHVTCRLAAGAAAARPRRGASKRRVGVASARAYRGFRWIRRRAGRRGAALHLRVGYRLRGVGFRGWVLGES